MRYLKLRLLELRVPSTIATTDTMPLPAGTTAVHVVLFEQLTLEAEALPNVNDVLPGVTSKPVPVMVTVKPAGPLDGEIVPRDGT